jgi:DNA polymerase elongation subunit (family B)
MTNFFRKDFPPQSKAQFPPDEVYITDMYDHDEFPWRITEEIEPKHIRNYAESEYQYDSGSDDEPKENESIHRRHTRKMKGGEKKSERKFTVVLFGCNDQGQSVAIHSIRNSAHLWVGPFRDEKTPEECIKMVKNLLRESLPRKYESHVICSMDRRIDFVGINSVQNFVRIDCYSLKSFYKVRYSKWIKYGLKSYESNLDPLIKYIHSLPFKGSEHKGIFWVKTTNMKPVKTKMTRCDLEYWCETSKIQVIEERVNVGKFLVLSFDIESYSEDWKFANNYRFEEYVIMISAIFQYYGDKNPVLRICFVFDERYEGPEVVERKYVDNNVEYTIITVYTRKRDILISKFFESFRDMSPELWTGYNIFGYDLHMLYVCAKKYGVWNYCSMMGKMIGKPTYLYHDKLRSSGIGEFNIVFPDFKGTPPIDMLVAVRSGFEKFISYKLNYIAKKKLNLEKKDISYSQMFWLYWIGKTDDIIEYNDYDSFLNWKIFDSFKIAINNIALCNLCGVSLRSRYLRGKCYGIHGKIINYTKGSNMIVPDIKKKHEETTDDDEETYGGGTVLDAKRGYYGKKKTGNPDDDLYVIVLDFTSLYPSVKISYNLGHDTVYNGVPPENEKHNYDLYQVNIKGVVHDVYVAKKSFRKSVLVELLISMLNKRKEYQAEMKKQTDPAVITAYDSLQNEAKMFNNSEYGTTGSPTSTLAHQYLAPLVTMLAGCALMKAIEITRKHFEDRGDWYDIIYGDTDSLFLLTNGHVLKKGPHKPRDYTEAERKKVETIENHPKLCPAKIAHVLNAKAKGEEVIADINKYYKDANLDGMGIKYEKVYVDLSLHKKKRYIGTKFEDGPVMKEIETRGLETKRRETSPYAAKMLETCHHDVFNERDYIETIRSFVKNLYKAPVDQLTMTKNVKSSGSYKIGLPAHGVLVEKMIERDPTTAPQINERVAYVFQKLPFQQVKYNGKFIKLKDELVLKIKKQYMILKRDETGKPKIFNGEIYSYAEVDVCTKPVKWSDVITRIEDVNYVKMNEIKIDYDMFIEKELIVRIARTIKQNEGSVRGEHIFRKLISELELTRHNIKKGLDTFKDEKPAKKKKSKKNSSV